MSVISTHIQAVVPPGALESDPDIGLHHLQYMPQMQRAVGIGQSAGHQYVARLRVDHSHPFPFAVKKGATIAVLTCIFTHCDCNTLQ